MAEADPAERKRRQQEYKRQYYEANREAILAKQQRYREANRDKLNAHQRQYRQANRDKLSEPMREARRRWVEKNPGYQLQWREKNREELRARGRQGYRANSDAINERNRRWREKNPEYGRGWHLLHHHGLDAAAFVAMWEAQERRCYLCRLDLKLDEAVVEHWHGCPGHSPKKSCRLCWRGLAHHPCNLIAGTAGDDPALLRIIADNLERANADVAARQES